jgi:hypothetical protein
MLIFTLNIGVRNQNNTILMKINISSRVERKHIKKYSKDR